MSMEVLQITVPTELAEEIRARVRSGEYASESDVVIDQFQIEDDPLTLSQEELEEAVRIADEMERYPERSLTLGDMRAGLAELHQRTLNAQ